MADVLVINFNSMLSEFVERLRETFPDHQLQLTQAGNGLRALSALGMSHMPLSMSASTLDVERLEQHDDVYMLQLLDSVKPLVGLDIRQLLTQCPAETQKNIWLYITELASIAKAYRENENNAPQMMELQAKADEVEHMLRDGMAPKDVLEAMTVKRQAGK